MNRQEVLDQFSQMFGSVPGWAMSLPDLQLEQMWNTLQWTFTDTALTARDKSLVGFGASAAIKCPF